MEKPRASMAPLLVAAVLLLLGAAWALTNPPGAGPDEGAHYVKAVGVGGGDFYGRAPGQPSRADIEALVNTRRSPGERAEVEAFLHANQSAAVLWQERTSREFTVPAGLGFSAFGCGYWSDGDWGRCLADGERSAAATDAKTYVGTYQPFAYIPPGVAMRASDDPIAALRIGRLANALLSLGLLVLAALVLWDHRRGVLSLVGLIVAITPAVVFFAANLNPTGPEIASGICFAATLLRLTRAPASPLWVWAVCAGAGSVLGLTRSLGPAFVALIVLAVVVLTGPRAAWRVIAREPRAAGLAAAAVAVACGAGFLWERRYQPHVPWGPGTILDGLEPSLANLDEMPRQVVGVFGALNISMPVTPYVIWWVMLAVLLAGALLVGRALERVGLVALFAAVVAVTLAVSAVYRQTGFELQARYVMPFAAILPLWAGELITRRPPRLGPAAQRIFVAGLIAAAVVVHGFGWYANARRASASADGDWWFASDASWLPPLGWWFWMGVVLVAAGAGIAAAFSTAYWRLAERHEPVRPIH